MKTALHSITLKPSEDCAREFMEALRTLGSVQGQKKIILEKGKYIFRKKDASVQTFAVSNTVTQEECQIKHIALKLEEVEDLILEGNNSKLIFEGDVSAILLDHCKNIVLKDFSVDYIHPRVSEMKVVARSGNTVEFRINPSSRWAEDEQRRFCFVNADGVKESLPTPQVVQVASPGNRSNVRNPFDPVRMALSFEKLSEKVVRFHYKEPPPLKEGEVWQFRDPSRRENGIVISECENVTLEGLHLCFTPGLGVVAQMTKDLTIRNHRHAPAEESARVCAAMADCIQVSSCYGRVEIGSSFFSGAQDDPINVHGTYLGVRSISGSKIIVEFCHKETWGFLPYKKGDIVAFVRRKDLQRLFQGTILQAELISKTLVCLELDKELLLPGVPEEFVLENMSSHPDVFIHDCHFECYPTRAILMSSAGKACITRNEIFHSSFRSPGIYISGDANSWYESGGVRDVEITENHFYFCSNAAISIAPEIEPGSGIVHRNIRIRNNHYTQCSPVLLRYHSVEGLETDLRSELIEKL